MVSGMAPPFLMVRNDRAGDPDMSTLPKSTWDVVSTSLGEGKGERRTQLIHVPQRFGPSTCWARSQNDRLSTGSTAMPL
jgi:hypothetical protein